jgi:hypothetical protein
MLYATPTTDVLPVVSVYTLVAGLSCQNLQERLVSLFFAWTRREIFRWLSRYEVPA